MKVAVAATASILGVAVAAINKLGTTVDAIFGHRGPRVEILWISFGWC